MSATTLPTVFTAAGLQPQTPAALNAQLIAQATALAPGLTILPAGLIEDLASTATGALVVIDQARVDLVASLTPNAANPWLLNQLGQVYGVAQGQDTNTGVFVVFTANAPGYIIPPGFVVSDGTYQYATQDASVITSTGSSQPVSCVATQPGSWAVPAGTVTQIVTSVPTTTSTLAPFAMTVTNPLNGTPSPGAQTEEDYRSQVLQAGLVTSTGAPAMLKTLLGAIPGVSAALISVRQQTGGGWEVIVGGSGDPYSVGLAIYQAVPNFAALAESAIRVTNITNANPAVVTTDLNHGYATGQNVQISGATGLVVLNNVIYPIVVLSQTTFSVPVNTSATGTYTGNGVVFPNFRNVIVNLYDYPDTYTVPFVIPPSQTVTMVVTWNSSSTGFVSATAVAASAQSALAAYVNGLPVGQPMNLFELQATFQAATAAVLPTQLLTRMVFAVSINGLGVAPEAGTGIIAGDPESYFTTTTAAIVVNQG